MSKVYGIVTDQIIEALERGTVPWRQPWSGGSAIPRNAVSKKPYRGVNPFLLAMTTNLITQTHMRRMNG